MSNPVKHGAARRPTVLLADDSSRILEMASSLLAGDFDIVAAVTDGRQALDAARRLDPDVAVLDVSMPALDGFQTARELKRAGSRAKIVMLTERYLDEYVAAAAESGADGYVFKARMFSDLARSIEHARAGRFSVPSVTSLLALVQAGAGGHAVHFRFDDRDAVEGLSPLLSAAIRQGDMVSVVMNDAVRAGIRQRLTASGCDLAKVASRGMFVEHETEAALRHVMSGGTIDASLVAGMVGDLEHKRIAAGAPRLTIVGEMSSLLCQVGQSDDAVRLENAWDDLTRRLPFLTVCSYTTALFEEADPALFPALCAPHWAVCHTH